ncbi:MAG: ribokinase [Armatimonadaceae bacterium]
MFLRESRCMKIVVVGSSNTDLVVRVPHIPAPGETVLGADMQTIPGGKGANQAVAAARLGGNVTFIARVGEDAYGAAAIAHYREEGLDVSHVHHTPGVPSGVALIAVQAGSGENAIVVAPGANAHLSVADLDAAADAIRTAQAVVLSLEVPMESVQRAAEIASDAGVPVVLNPAPAQELPAELLSKISVLTPNQTEARQLLGVSENEVVTPEDLAKRLLSLGIGAAVLTVGKDGCLVATSEGVEAVPGYAVSAIDTVAAGDCFTGALAVEMAQGKPLRDAARFANAAAAVKVTRHGAQPGLPTRADVEAFQSSASE